MGEVWAMGVTWASTWSSEPSTTDMISASVDAERDPVVPPPPPLERTKAPPEDVAQSAVRVSVACLQEGGEDSLDKKLLERCAE